MRLVMVQIKRAVCNVTEKNVCSCGTAFTLLWLLKQVLLPNGVRMAMPARGRFNTLSI
jgi:hypothetical protein